QILDIALGLEYLHGQHGVHGDLKGISPTNVLVTRACIVDFGLSSIADAMTLRFTYSTASARGGTAWYQASELLLGERSNYFGSDVYAFACVCYEVCALPVPFFELPNDIAVSIKVTAGQRPSRPESVQHALWILIQDCWEQSSDKHPTITEIVQRLDPEIGTETARSATDWDETFSSKFRRSLQDSFLPSVTKIKERLENAAPGMLP
ncbi:kinase-like domain-containing protein, partial [Mycena latifolia]